MKTAEDERLNLEYRRMHLRAIIDRSWMATAEDRRRWRQELARIELTLSLWPCEGAAS